MRILLAAVLVAAVWLIPASAQATDKEWRCHRTGSETNPWVLIHVPVNSAHFDATKHPEDKAPTVEDDVMFCDTDADPEEPFTGSIKLDLEVLPARCLDTHFGIDGWSLTVEVYINGELVDSDSVTFPERCILRAAGAPGPAGADGDDGKNGANGAAGSDADGCLTVRKPRLRMRYKGTAKITRLRVFLEGERVKVKRVATPDPALGSKARKLREWRTERLDLAGTGHKVGGVYGVHIRYRKDGVVKRRVHWYRGCFGGAHNGFGLNARPIVRL